MKSVKEFVPHPLLRNRHLMTIAPAFLRRRFPRLPPGESRLFDVEPGTQLRGHCHWHAEPRKHPTLLLVHGRKDRATRRYRRLRGEGICSWLERDPPNQRNCGGTERLTPTLYIPVRSDDFVR